jgi:hypothetical protein
VNRGTGGGTGKLLTDPHVGLLRMDYSSYWLTSNSGARMVVYSPLDDETRRRLEKLALIDLG